MDNEHTKSFADNLYLLSFIDVMDRLDILMLEIRHLQQIIIYSLKAPSLYLPLRYEESYLFGDNWHTKISDILVDDSRRNIDLANKWVIRYPTPRAAVKYYCANKEIIENEDSDKKIERTISHRVGKIWMGDNWVRDQRRQYHSLYALQLLKQHVLCDKIALARASLQADLLNAKQIHLLKKPAFLILRAGVLKKVDEYVLILRNHKHQVGQSIVFGMPTDPHPSTERRRDMGIFMDFIFNRTVDIQGDILHLYKAFKQEELQQKENSLLMFHGWSQDTMVSTLQLDDIFSDYEQVDINAEVIEKHPIGYVNSSFWTPDRPDLHPIIAYFVGESVIRNILGGLDAVTLSNAEDEFTALIATLKKIFNENIKQKESELAYLKSNIDDVLKKIAADFLAASVKGVAYLYSLFLIIIGHGLESQLYVGKKIKLEMVNVLEQGVATYDDAIVWYLRLNLTAVWLKKVVNKLSVLDEKIIEAVEIVSNELLGFLNNYTPYSRDRIVPCWKKLLLSLIDKLEGHEAVKASKKWRRGRSKDGCQSNDSENQPHQENNRYYARSTRGLNIRLQNYLFRELLNSKIRKGGIFYKKSDHQIKKDFESRYYLPISTMKIPNENGKTVSHPKALFSHIYDIPYQSCFIESIDLLKKKRRNYAELFEKLHWDMELGRGPFSFALEFHTRESESPRQRLSLCINQIAYIYEDVSKNKELKNLAKSLRQWLKGEEKIELTKHTLKQRKDEIYKKPSLFGANALAEYSAKLNLEQEMDIRQLESVMGYKLKELFQILKDNGNYKGKTEETKQIYRSFYALMQFLSLRKCDEDDPCLSKKELFYNHILAALGDIPKKDKKHYEFSKSTDHLKEEYLPKPVRNLMLHRLSMTNYYPIPNPIYLENDNSNQNGLFLAENLEKCYWKTMFKQEEELSETWVTLGRFDAVSLIEVRLPCKCYIQGFKDGLTLPHKDQNACVKEQFSSYFSHREIARSVDIFPEIGKCQMFALLNVTLQRRSMRLDFLYRMIRALKEGKLNYFQSNIEIEIKKLAEKKIFVTALLTDGWGDIVFKFSKEVTNKEKHANLTVSDIESVFKFQEAVYEDFMADRTEIIFTPQCVDYTLAFPDKYRITMEVRMMEDRWLEAGITKYINVLKDISKKQPSFLKEMKIMTIAGRNDFHFEFIPQNDLFFEQNKNKYPNKLIKGAYKKIIQWLNQDGEKGAMRMLSHVETYISSCQPLQKII